MVNIVRQVEVGGGDTCGSTTGRQVEENLFKSSWFHAMKKTSSSYESIKRRRLSSPSCRKRVSQKWELWKLEVDHQLWQFEDHVRRICRQVHIVKGRRQCHASL
jgi:hypothetical protein